MNSTIIIIFCVITTVLAKHHHNKTHRYVHTADILYSKAKFFRKTNDYVQKIMNQIFNGLDLTKQLVKEPKIKRLLTKHHDLNNVVIKNLEIYDLIRNLTRATHENNIKRNIRLEKLVKEILNENEINGPIEKKDKKKEETLVPSTLKPKINVTETVPASKPIHTIGIGCRDWVGFGVNGSANYKDDPHFPFPAVRFKENSRDICALRQKEKGDWRMLCCEEKKALYRASFCQTFAEFQHPTGQWKVVVGVGLFCMSFTFWVFMFNHHYVWEPLPATLARASQKAQLRRMLELRVNPIDGLSSKWDYDNDRWKQ